MVVEAVGGRSRSEEKSKGQTFTPRLEIVQMRRDSHFSLRHDGDGRFERTTREIVAAPAAWLDY
jgi:hypothetical protein